METKNQITFPCLNTTGRQDNAEGHSIKKRNLFNNIFVYACSDSEDKIK